METKLENELLELETRFWNSVKTRDVATAVALTADPCIVSGAQGVAQIDRQAFTRMMEAENWTLHDFTIKDVKVQRLSDDVAVIGYKVHENLTVEGKPVSLDAADTSTWVRKDGRWLCAMHAEALVGDPFGRDRSPARGSMGREVHIGL